MPQVRCMSGGLWLAAPVAPPVCAASPPASSMVAATSRCRGQRMSLRAQIHLQATVGHSAHSGTQHAQEGNATVGPRAKRAQTRAGMESTATLDTVKSGCPLQCRQHPCGCSQSLPAGGFASGLSLHKNVPPAPPCTRMPLRPLPAQGRASGALQPLSLPWTLGLASSPCCRRR